MSQFLLDEQLAANDVLEPLRKRLKLGRLKDLRPQEQILDERIPELLRTLKYPTFLTLDHDFWNGSWCHPDYAIIYFAFDGQGTGGGSETAARSLGHDRVRHTQVSHGKSHPPLQVGNKILAIRFG